MQLTMYSANFRSEARYTSCGKLKIVYNIDVIIIMKFAESD